MITHQQSISFSIIIPLFNKEHSICSTINSVLSQTYSEFEIIIVNDGSTDNSLEKAQSINDERIRIFSKKNGGVSSARNFGINNAINEYVVFLDADDIWLPFCLEEFINLIRNFHLAKVFSTNFNMTGKRLKGSNRNYYIDDYYYSSAFFLAKWSIQMMVTGCVCIDKKVFEEVGMFDETITHGEDLDLWERLNIFKIAKSERITMIYRIDAENRASILNSDAKKIKDDYLKHLRSRVKSKSQRLYYSVLLFFELRSLQFPFSSLVKFGDWLIIGMLFVIKIRFLK
jgi:glycosyltransferase involved in cell wall biosynthesis